MVKCCRLDAWQSGISLPIPNSILELRKLNLKQNKMSGTIPQALDSLVILESLYLSYNKISGQIPEGTAYILVAWFARLDSQDSRESEIRVIRANRPDGAIKIGVSITNDSGESIRANRVANRPGH